MEEEKKEKWRGRNGERMLGLEWGTDRRGRMLGGRVVVMTDRLVKAGLVYLKYKFHLPSLVHLNFHPFVKILPLSLGWSCLIIDLGLQDITPR